MRIIFVIDDVFAVVDIEQGIAIYYGSKDECETYVRHYD